MSDNAWNVRLKDVNPGFDEVPEGRYTFALMGASESKYFPGAIELKVTIISEGEAQGRIMFPRYSNPEVWKASPKALKRLEQSLGVDILPEEDNDGLAGKLAFLNRAAKDGARFTGDVGDASYENKETKELVKKTELKLFSVGPGQ